MRGRDMVRRLMILTGAVGVLLVACCSAASAGTLPVRICGPNGVAPASFYDPGSGLSSTSAPGVSPLVGCPVTGLQSPGLELGGAQASKNASAGFKVTAPPGIVIQGIHVINASSQGVDDGAGWSGWFYWNGGPGPAGNAGTSSLNGNFHSAGCCSQGGLNSQSIGWFIACEFSSCSQSALVYVGELDLTAEEDQGPTILPSGTSSLWTQPGWVRGRWNASIGASDPSGVCGGFVTLGSLPAAGVARPTFLPDRSRWLQCPEQGVSTTVDTSASQGSQGLGEGAMSLTAGADNAAGVHSPSAKTVMVDNSTPTISLSGPTDAPATNGTEYVTATAGGSPSGISTISCSTDGGPQQESLGATAYVPVAGIGQHTVTCSAANNAVDPAGNRGTAAPASRSLKIGQPTALGISFSKLVGLRCGRVREKVRTHGRTKLVRVVRCHPRTVRRRVVVSVTIRRHGRLVRVKRRRFVRVVVPPHAVSKTAKRVAFGHFTTVNGWLGTADGNALVGQSVRVLSAPDNGMGHFSQAAVVTTSANGSWRATLPAGPSRLVEAIYDGGPTTETTSSVAVHLAVPAMVQIHVHLTVVPWGSHLRITGRVLGGYIPPHSNVLRLLFGDGPRPHTIGNPEIRRDGRFSIPISWSAGRGVVNYWFAVATLAEADYPYARGVSRRVVVTVGLRR